MNTRSSNGPLPGPKRRRTEAARSGGAAFDDLHVGEVRVASVNAMPDLGLAPGNFPPAEADANVAAQVDGTPTSSVGGADDLRVVENDDIENTNPNIPDALDAPDAGLRGPQHAQPPADVIADGLDAPLPPTVVNDALYDDMDPQAIGPPGGPPIVAAANPLIVTEAPAVIAVPNGQVTQMSTANASGQVLGPVQAVPLPPQLTVVHPVNAPTNASNPLMDVPALPTVGGPVPHGAVPAPPAPAPAAVPVLVGEPVLDPLVAMPPPAAAVAPAFVPVNVPAAPLAVAAPALAGAPALGHMVAPAMPGPLGVPVFVAPPALGIPVNAVPPQAAVAPVIPLPAILDGELLPDVVQQMLAMLATQSNPAENMYAVSQVPAAADWGTGTNERILYHDRRPLIVTLPGRLHSLWFYDRDGRIQARVNVGLMLNVDGDYAAVQEMYTRARPRSKLESDVVYASRLQTVRERGMPSAQVVPFERVYDATAGVAARGAMRRLTPADFTVGDIVLVDCYLTRWKKPTEVKKRAWTAWDVGFELQGMSLLFAAP